jgi:predicted adenine nucleotide alpha hydrolase (AANH) superfamily ATPase
MDDGKTPPRKSTAQASASTNAAIGERRRVLYEPVEAQTPASANAAIGEPLPRLLLHCCCAPCATVALERLSPSFRITCLFYNPNIMPRVEHGKRLGELKRLLATAWNPDTPGQPWTGADAPADRLAPRHPITLLETDTDATGDADAFIALAKPYWDEPEGGRRCAACIELRLERTAGLARKNGYDCFATTLSVGPRKHAALINEIGAKLSEKYCVEYLPNDFKKGGGFARSVELSKQYGLYRQNYCGCKTNKGL